MVVIVLKVYVLFVVFVMVVYAVRHYSFVLSRTAGEQKAYYQDIVDSELPFISVLIPMHNEQKVASNILNALIDAEYPKDRMEIVPINDHSTDDTKRILDEYADRYPYIRPLHRNNGRRGKPSALNDGLKVARGEIVIVFDAHYIPPKGILRDLAISFKNPEVGAVMGRVVPENTGTNLLTRLLDLERTGGYQVDQQARYNLGLIPQYGGTVGGFRRTIVLGLGGFDPEVLAEDTELTFRLQVKGWKVVYANRAECYEEVPEDWNSRASQIMRWSRGHTQTMFKFIASVIRSPYLDFKEKLDGVLLLLVYTIPVLLLTGFMDSIALFFMNEMQLVESLFVFLFVAGYNTFGNFAPFYQVGTAAFLDGATARIRLLPFLLFNFIFNLWYISQGFLGAVWDRIRGKTAEWQKTRRYRGGGPGRRKRRKGRVRPLPVGSLLTAVIVLIALTTMGIAVKANTPRFIYSYDEGEVETIEVVGHEGAAETPPAHRHYAAAALLLMIYLGMLALPFVPAAAELFRPKDDKRLYINKDYVKDPRYFGRSFRRILKRAIGTDVPPNGTRRVKLSKEEEVESSDNKNIPPEQSLDKVQYIAGELVTGRGVEFKNDLYVRGRASIGENSLLRTMACDSDVLLKKGTRLVRWLDAEGSITVEDGCNLGISASCEGTLALGKGCEFKRLFGKPVVTYGYVERESKSRAKRMPQKEPPAPNKVKTVEDVATLVKGNTRLSSSYYKGKRIWNLIVKGDLIVEDGAVLDCSASVYGRLTVGKGAVVRGNLFCEGDVEIKEGAAVHGDIFSQGEVRIERGVRIGEAGRVKSIIGKSAVRLAGDVCIHGYVLTEGRGTVE